jgi:hypothetical protein
MCFWRKNWFFVVKQNLFILLIRSLLHGSHVSYPLFVRNVRLFCLKTSLKTGEKSSTLERLYFERFPGQKPDFPVFKRFVEAIENGNNDFMRNQKF